MNATFLSVVISGMMFIPVFRNSAVTDEWAFSIADVEYSPTFSQTQTVLLQPITTKPILYTI